MGYWSYFYIKIKTLDYEHHMPSWIVLNMDSLILNWQKEVIKDVLST